ncbi:hypothetical protein KA183_14130 [bacterium]|nr:hypothetical protein [bacterium]QQR58443.1 MAG: hypothetical protein IPG59_02800 [Candidatus Melainabacteria bacterium]
MADLDTRAQAAAQTLDDISDDQNGIDKTFAAGGVFGQIMDYAVQRMQDAKAAGTLPTTIEGQNDFLAQQQLDMALMINQYDNKALGYNIQVNRKPGGQLQNLEFVPAKK